MKTPTLLRILLEVGNYKLSLSKLSKVLDNKRAFKKNSSVIYGSLNVNWISVKMSKRSFNHFIN